MKLQINSYNSVVNFIVIILVCSFVFGDIAVWAQPDLSLKSSTLAPASRLRLESFFGHHELDFANIAHTIMAAGALKKAILVDNLREGPLHSKIDELNGIFSDGAVKIEKEVKAVTLKCSGKEYKYATFHFKKENKTFNVFFFNDHAALTVAEKEELGIIKKDAEGRVYDDSYHLDCPGLEGVWFVKIDAQRLFVGTDNQQKPKELQVSSAVAPDWLHEEFRIGGINSDSAIQQILAINDVPIAQIERNARPGEYSAAGFIGAQERLIDILVRDNQFVRSQGLTHKDLAEPLRIAMEVQEGLFFYDGQAYYVSHTDWRTEWSGPQLSIFNDGLETNRDYIVHSLGADGMTPGAKIIFSEIQPEYIARYGFYEGDTPYRLDPAAIIDMFFRPPACEVLRSVTAIATARSAVVQSDLFLRAVTEAAQGDIEFANAVAEVWLNKYIQDLYRTGYVHYRTEYDSSAGNAVVIILVTDPYSKMDTMPIVIFKKHIGQITTYYQWRGFGNRINRDYGAVGSAGALKERLRDAMHSDTDGEKTKLAEWARAAKDVSFNQGSNPGISAQEAIAALRAKIKKRNDKFAEYVRRATDALAHRQPAKYNNAVMSGETVLKGLESLKEELSEFLFTMEIPPAEIPQTISIVRAKLGEARVRDEWNKYKMEMLHDEKDMDQALVCMQEITANTLRDIDRYSMQLKALTAVEADLNKCSSAAVPDNAICSVADVAKMMHEQNLEYGPTQKEVAEKTLICQVIADSVVPIGQRDMIQRLGQHMARPEHNYIERLARLDDKEPTKFMDTLRDAIKSQERDNPGRDIEYYVACSRPEDVETILQNVPALEKEFSKAPGALKIRAIAFEGPGADVNAVQVEGIMLALRALRKGPESLRAAYKLLTGADMAVDSNDIVVMMKRALFKVPAARIDVSKVGELNKLIEEYIKSAA